MKEKISISKEKLNSMLQYERNVGWNCAVRYYQDEVLSIMKKIYDKYESDVNNVPKPDFLSAVALIVTVGDGMIKKE